MVGGGGLLHLDFVDGNGLDGRLTGLLVPSAGSTVIPLRLFTTISHKNLCFNSKTSGDASDKI